MGVQYSISSIYNVTGNAYNSSAKTGSITQPTNGAGGKFTTHRLTNTTFISKWSYAEAEFAITPPSSPDIYKDITIKYRYKYSNDVSGSWQDPTVKLGHKDASGNKIYGTYTHGGSKGLSKDTWSSWYTETLAPALNSGQYRLIMHIQNNQDLSALLGVTVEIESITINYTPHTCNFSIETARTPSTCCTKGSVTKKCSVSGCTKTQTTELALDSNNHTGGTEVRNVKSATCTATGYTGDTYCKGCGVKISSGSTIAALGHNYTSVVTKPTVDSPGYTTHTCTRCGHSYVDSYVYFPKFTAVSMTYLNKQISETNKVKCKEGFIISVAVT